ncbi:nicotinate-nucleotide--dimethylbenzimidazole phosphoribosyltransferase [Streptantibioticus ferralitis]|uniref:Nicotinate-nucleotide--dimethylbenzimidazole phosphoribosyltransferase n=1 Tax=Streptantibioticus ferralitis TaxID=236510 RepID=A0ABT5Z625_9ACTN|nr:nicotinate-nucleotide--dimethylbenzimidazole phosphoribosyltransferase [Streptantibioticus ferralitis]MDF2259274.1 nicotinate-nucleotide--dimethylbenzimidazole phosphoribosyltransferase [Streptantibioticus ferralitis]
MTDTGPVPGEGLPENVGGEAVQQPHAERTGEAAKAAPQSGHGWSTDAFLAPATPAFTFLDQPDGVEAPVAVEDEDDLLLMPAPQGSWGDPQPVPAQPVPVQPAPPVVPPAAAPQQPVAPAAVEPEPVVADAGLAPQGVERPVAAADFAATPASGTPAQGVPAASAPGSAGQAVPPRRPLNMGPPMPSADAVGGVSVRSLAERGPAPAPASPAPVHQPESQLGSGAGDRTPGPEYLDAPAGEPAAIPAQQNGDVPVSGGPWIAAETTTVTPATVTPATATPATGTEALVPGEPAAAAEAPAEQAQPKLPAQQVGESSLVSEGAPAEPAVPVVAVEESPAAAVAAEEAPAEAAQFSVPVQAAPETPEAPAQSTPVVPTAVVESVAEAPLNAPADEPGGLADLDREPIAVPAPVLAESEPVTVPAANTVLNAAPQPDTSAEAPAPGIVAPQAAAPGIVAPQAAAPGIVAPQAAAPGIVAPQAAEPEVVAAQEPAATDTAPEESTAQAPAEPAVAEQPEQPVADVVVPQPEAAGQASAAEPQPEPVAAATEAAPPAASAETPGSGDAEPALGISAAGYDEAVREAVHRVIRERRDIRNGFRPDPIPHEVLLRVLEAAHTAPSVGHSQPWDFVVIRSTQTREKMHALAMKQRDAYAKSLPKARAKQFRELKIEAILETPVNIVVTADPTRGGRHTLGRHTQPQMAPYSSALAVENLWLAARAEGLGVGWVSFFDEREMVRELGLPEHLEVVAYLCVGYVDEFPEEPELMQAGWAKRRPLSWVVHEEEYGRRALPGEQPHDLLDETLRGIRPLDAKALGEAWERQKRMTKPSGALGMLEIISAQLCGLSRQCPPPIPEPAAVAIFAGDHGVHAQGVTAWPQEVTAQMVANFLGGGAVCNAFANQVGAEVCVVDVGVAAELPTTPGLLPRKVRHGTGDFTTGPAMTREEVLRAIEVGIETARDLVAAGNKALLTGEMGIANTTASAALISVYTGVGPAEVTGRGTGINDEMHARKVDVVRRALELHQPDPTDPVGVLAAIGGLEHAAMVGLVLGGASLRTPVILDGVSAGAAALVARAIAPEALAACIAGHRSAEPGHVAALTKLGLRPLVDLDLRLGEGTGALLALPLVQSAARVMHEVATFDSAGVTEKG